MGLADRKWQDSKRKCDGLLRLAENLEVEVGGGGGGGGIVWIEIYNYDKKKE